MKHFRVPRITHERIQQAASLVAVMGFTLFVASPVTTLAAESAVFATNNDTTVTTQETYSALRKTEGVLDTSKQTKTTSDSADSLKAASAGATLTIHKDAKKGVKLEQLGISVSLPNAYKAKHGKTVANGTVAYEGVNGSANAIQANDDGSVRMLTVIDNPNAPTKYDYQLALPQGARLQLEQDGSVTIRKTTAPNTEETLAVIDNPWAKDANGRAIQTHYTVHSSTLTQHIKHRVKGVVYPVTGDPRISRSWHGVTFYLSRNETNYFATAGGVALSVLGIAAGVGGATGAQAAADWAARHHKCLAVYKPWAYPFITSYWLYNC